MTDRSIEIEYFIRQVIKPIFLIIVRISGMRNQDRFSWTEPKTKQEKKRRKKNIQIHRQINRILFNIILRFSINFLVTVFVVDH